MAGLIQTDRLFLSVFDLSAARYASLAVDARHHNPTAEKALFFFAHADAKLVQYELSLLS